MGEHATNRTRKDIESLASFYDELDELDDVHKFEDAPEAEFDFLLMNLPDRFDRFVDHGWIEINRENDAAAFTYAGYSIASYAQYNMDELERLSAPEFISKAGSNNGIVLE